MNRLSHSKRIAAAAIASVLVVALSVAIAQAATTKKITLKSQSVASLNADVLAAPTGRTLYRLKPETTRHVLCTTQCLQFWKPLTVKSKSTTVKLPSGIHGQDQLPLARQEQVPGGPQGLAALHVRRRHRQGTRQRPEHQELRRDLASLTVKKSTVQHGTQPPTMTNPAPYALLMISSSITVRMPSWACIRSKPWFTSSSVIRCEMNGSTSMLAVEVALHELRAPGRGP